MNGTSIPRQVINLKNEPKEEDGCLRPVDIAHKYRENEAPFLCKKCEVATRNYYEEIVPQEEVCADIAPYVYCDGQSYPDYCPHRIKRRR